MALNLVFTPAAKADLESLYDWWAGREGPERAASSVRIMIGQLFTAAHRSGGGGDGFAIMDYEPAAIAWTIRGSSFRVLRILDRDRDREAAAAFAKG